MKQARLNKHLHASPSIEDTQSTQKPRVPPRLMDVNLTEYKNSPLWPILVETTRRSPLYAGLMGYAHEKILPEEPNITAKELATKLSISLGEALVILDSYYQRSAFAK